MFSVSNLVMVVNTICLWACIILLYNTVMYIPYLQVILRADKTTNNFSDRAILKNLGHWLGMQTLAKNKPILQNVRFIHISAKNFAGQKFCPIWLPLHCYIFTHVVKIAIGSTQPLIQDKRKFSPKGAGGEKGKNFLQTKTSGSTIRLLYKYSCTFKCNTVERDIFADKIFRLSIFHVV